MKQTKWFDRTFAAIEDNGLLPGVIERLEGTRARLEMKAALIGDHALSPATDESWGVKKQIGHLIDLEPLWLQRVGDFVAGNADLTPADLTNKKTHDADHDARTLEELIGEFGKKRILLVEMLRSLEGSTFDRSLLHPRLKTPMRIIDLAYFVAEHDDHHLARISNLMNKS